jgi:hypothetical protein
LCDRCAKNEVQVNWNEVRKVFYALIYSSVRGAPSTSLRTKGLTSASLGMVDIKRLMAIPTVKLIELADA